MTKEFYIKLLTNSELPTGFSVAVGKAEFAAAKEPMEVLQVAEASAEVPDDFKSVLETFTSAMESYRQFIRLTLGLVPLLSTAIVDREMRAFAKKNGTVRPDLSDKDGEVYQLGLEKFGEFNVISDTAIATMRGATFLPEIMMIGLISTYDVFLASFLRLILSKHEEIIMTSDKAIKFSELSSFGSIEQARISLIEREVDGVIRLSHHEQFDWMTKRLSVKLREDLPSWPRFIEICERRNLFTHTGGHVTPQYISNCKIHGVDISGVNLGQKLKVTPEYYKTSVQVVYEIGVKLAHVLWRKFAKEKREEADSNLSRLGYELIFKRAYSLAETLLRFGTETLKSHSSERVRRMMLINRANAIRLQGRKAEAVAVIAREDWSAASAEFQICAAAVREELNEVIRLMEKIGTDGIPTAEDYRTWPVFRGLRTQPLFIDAFQKVFGEAIIQPKTVEIETLPHGALESMWGDDEADRVLMESKRKTELDSES